MENLGSSSRVRDQASDCESAIKILCVDDLLPNLISLEAALAGYGYELVLVQSGREALAAIDLHEFAVILLDVQMPVLDGYKTAQLIRSHARSRSTPIIFLTANYPSEQHTLQGYEVGAVDYLFKPLNLGVLRAKIAVFADLFRKNREISRQAQLIREGEQRERERELAEVKRISERKYQHLVEGIREGIVWSADSESLQFSFVSRHAEKITGYPMAKWLEDNHFWEKHIPDSDRARVFNAFDAARSHPDRHAGIEHELIRADGTRIWLHTEIRLDRESGGSRPELHGLSVDITHLKRTETALREAVRVRDDAIQIREDFLSIASHELKTPITPLQLQMQGFIRMIETGRLAETPTDQLKTMLEISDSQVTRLSRLIGQLLDVSRLRDGKLGLVVEDVNLSQLVRNVLDQLRSEIEMSECSVSPFLDEEIHGCWDRLRIEQVLINLLLNATKYAAGGKIEISTRQQGGQAVFTVKDYGMGIAKEDQERIFDRFERAVPLKNFGGLGLGLYISRQIVQTHHGSIRVESEPSHGAAFTVTLPLNGSGPQ